MNDQFFKLLLQIQCHQYKIMSIHYSQNQTFTHKHTSSILIPNQSLKNRSQNQKATNEIAIDNRGTTEGKSKNGPNISQTVNKEQEQSWQNIENVTVFKHPSLQRQQGQLSKQKKFENKEPRGLKDKIPLIVNKFEEDNSVAEMTHYHQDSDNDANLKQSTSTIQSNNRRKYKTLPRNLDQTPKNNPIKRLGNNFTKNRQKTKNVQDDGEGLELQDKPKKASKSQPKYLFYNIVKEDQGGNEAQGSVNTKPVKGKLIKKQAVIIDLKNQLPDYEYQKGVHRPNQKKIERLKNKLGYIFDLFQKTEEVASVSYYSQSQDQQIDIQPNNQQLPQAKVQVQKEEPPANIFHTAQVQQEEYNKQGHSKEPKSNEIGPERHLVESNEFQSLNLPTKPLESQAAKVQIPTEQRKQLSHPGESAFQKIKRSIKINNSLQRVELQMIQAFRNRSKSRISATKSVENKPKISRYQEDDEHQIQVHQSRRKKKSVDLSALSRHIKNSLNKQQASINSNENANEAELSKSKSQGSKFSLRLVQVQAKKQQENQSKSISKKQSNSKPPSQNMAKDEPFEEEPAAKKLFPIARMQSLTKNNNPSSKHMRIDFKEDASIPDDMEEQIPNIALKKTDTFHKSRTLEAHNKPTVKVNIKPNQQVEEDKIAYKPINKIEFNIQRSKRLKTELVQPKEELSDQQKKFLALLRKREDALLRRVKEQVKINNPNIILQDAYDQRSKQLSNETFEKIISKQDSSSSNKSPVNYYRAERRDKMSLKTDNPQQPEVHSYFPTLNLSPSTKDKQNYQTFYANTLQKNSSRKAIFNFSKKKVESEHYSSETDRKTLDQRFEDVKNDRRQGSKIGYYNIKKLHKETSMNERNLNSKEKYERLKQLLQQI